MRSPLAEVGYRHRPHTRGADPRRAAPLLPRVHRVFGNLHTWLRGTHHGVGHKHLQVYLDEFAFRFNRRRTSLRVTLREGETTTQDLRIGGLRD